MTKQVLSICAFTVYSYRFRISARNLREITDKSFEQKMHFLRGSHQNGIMYCRNDLWGSLSRKRLWEPFHFVIFRGSLCPYLSDLKVRNFPHFMQCLPLFQRSSIPNISLHSRERSLILCFLAPFVRWKLPGSNILHPGSETFVLAVLHGSVQKWVSPSCERSSFSPVSDSPFGLS